MCRGSMLAAAAPALRRAFAVAAGLLLPRADAAMKPKRPRKFLPGLRAARFDVDLATPAERA